MGMAKRLLAWLARPRPAPLFGVLVIGGPNGLERRR
jgi:hypothetical protein